MPAEANPAPSSAMHPVAAKIRGRRSRMIWIAGVIGLLSIALAVFGSGTNRILGLYFAGLCGVLWIPLSSWLYTRKVRAVNRVANSANALARWTYSEQERAVFLVRERERLRWKRKDTFAMIAVCGGLGLVVCVVGGLIYGWNVSTDIVIFVFFALFGALLYVVNVITLAQLPARLSGEVIIASEGVLTPKQLSDWGTNEAQLIEAVFVPEVPAEMQFKIRRTTQTQEGASVTTEDLRLPVPVGREDEARAIADKLMGRG